MGGDFAPAATLEGALLALREMEEEDSLVLIGDSALIEANEDIRNLAGDRLTIIHAPDVIGMGDQPYVPSPQNRTPASRWGSGC
jgi:glycerol-3-phosphate acyltransferase PlsX